MKWQPENLQGLDVTIYWLNWVFLLVGSLAWIKVKLRKDGVKAPRWLEQLPDRLLTIVGFIGIVLLGYILVKTW